MAFPKVPISVIIICIIFALIGGLWGAQTAGVLDVKGIVSKLPFIEEDSGQIAEIEISPLEEENTKLKDEIDRLNLQLNEANQILKSSIDEIGKLNEQIELLKNENTKLKNIDEITNNLVGYYQEMKPKEIVPIFENLDDEMVLRVMVKLDSNLVAKILAAMDPMRAAKLTKNLTDL